MNKKKLVFFLLATIIYLILFPVNKANALVTIPPGGSASYVNTSVRFIDSPKLPSPGDIISVRLTIKNTLSEDVTFSGDIGVDFYTVGGNADGKQTYFSNPGARKTVTNYTVPANSSRTEDFTTGIVGGGCLSGDVQIQGVPYFFTTVGTLTEDSYTTSGGIGATVYGNIFKPDGSSLDSTATVTLVGRNFDPDGGVNTGSLYQFKRVDCTQPHTIEATSSDGTLKKSIFLPAVTPENPNGTGTICNGESRRFNITMSPVAGPTNTPVPTVPGATATPVPTGTPAATSTPAPTATPAPLGNVLPPLIKTWLIPSNNCNDYDLGTHPDSVTYGQTVSGGETIPLALCFKNANNESRNVTENADFKDISSINLTWTIPNGLTPQGIITKPDGGTDTGCTISGQTVTCDNLYPAGTPIQSGNIDGRIVPVTVNSGVSTNINVPRATAVRNEWITNPHFQEGGRYPSNEWGQGFGPDNSALVNGWKESYTFSSNSITIPVGVCPGPPTGLSPNQQNICKPGLQWTQRLQWDAIPNAEWYDIRVDDGDNTQNTASVADGTANNCGSGVTHDICVNRWTATQAGCANPTPGTKCHMDIVVSVDKQYSWWMHASAGICSGSPQSVTAQFQTSCVVPTESPTPTPTPTISITPTNVPGSLNTTFSQSCSVTANKVDLSVSFTEIGQGVTSYIVSIFRNSTTTSPICSKTINQSGTGQLKLQNTVGASHTISPCDIAQSDQTTYIARVAAYDPGLAKSEDITKGSISCNGAIPTPTPTSGPTCTNDFGGGCIIGDPTNCFSGTGKRGTPAQNTWCQNINSNPSYICKVCPPPPPPPTCNILYPLNSAPTVSPRPGTTLVDVTYPYVSEETQLSGGLYRSNNLGFIPGGGGEKTGEQFGGNGLSFDTIFDAEKDKYQVLYYQAEAKSGNKTNYSQTVGAFIPPKTDYPSCGSLVYKSSLSVIDASQIANDPTDPPTTVKVSITFKFSYPFGGGPRTPPSTPYGVPYLQFTGSSGKSAFISGDAHLPNPVGHCEGTGDMYICPIAAKWTYIYVIDLPPSTTDTYTIDAYSGDLCNNGVSVAGNKTLTLSTIEGVIPNPKTPNLNVSASQHPSWGYPLVKLTWPETQQGEKVNIYKSKTRWTGDYSVCYGKGGCGITYDKDLSAYMYKGTDDVKDLKPGTYYYGADVDRYGQVGYCEARDAYTAQTPFVWTGYSITGTIFFDNPTNTAGRGRQDAGEPNYLGKIIVTARDTSGNVVDKYECNTSIPGDCTGNYTLHVAKGNYTISFKLPDGYDAIYPAGFGGETVDPSYQVIVRAGACSDVTDKDPLDPQSKRLANPCSNGSISGADFAITSIPWFQGAGADLRLDHEFTDKIPNPIPTTAPKLNASNPLQTIGQTPGVIFSGSGMPNFGKGQSSTTGWVVSGPTAKFTPVNTGIIRTSYNYLLATVKQSGVAPTNIKTLPGCSSLLNCTLPPESQFSSGVYKADYSLVLTSALGKYVFGAGKNYVILVDGDLIIKEQLIVPNGSTVTFSVSGNIIVDKSVGAATLDTNCILPPKQSYTSTGCQIEGFYSADNNIIIDGNNGYCTTGPDKRINAAGVFVANAALQPDKFWQQNRSLCDQNPIYPAFTITERPDFLLNAPEFIKSPSFVWQEIAP